MFIYNNHHKHEHSRSPTQSCVRKSFKFLEIIASDLLFHLAVDGGLECDKEMKTRNWLIESLTKSSP